MKKIILTSAVIALTALSVGCASQGNSWNVNKDANGYISSDNIKTAEGKTPSQEKVDTANRGITRR